MKRNDSVVKMWQAFTLQNPEYKQSKYGNWYFGDSEEMALELSGLVMKGIKTATCGALWDYEAEGDPIPEKGEFNVITDYHGKALCIIQTRNVLIQKFSEVDENFARKEGEGDLSYAYWHKAHTDFFTRIDIPEDPKFSDDMLLVCEEFEVVFPIKFAP